MSNEQLSTKIALLEQNQKTNEQIHLTMMEQFKEYNNENKAQHQELKELIAEMRLDVKEALESKADKATVDRIQGFINWFGALVAVGVVSYIGTLFIKLIDL